MAQEEEINLYYHTIILSHYYIIFLLLNEWVTDHVEEQT